MESLTGYIDHIIYQNPENGYTVLVLVTEAGEITCVGTFRYADEGEMLRLKGDYTTHAVYGEQFLVKEYEIIAPTDAVSAERYLGSGAVKGIGPAMAKKIVKEFGDDTFRVLEEEPELLVNIKGISEKKARDIASQVMEKHDFRKVMVFLQNYGIGVSLANKIYARYEQNIIKIINENPYILAEDINGVGFKTADEIASKIGIHTDSDYRIRSGILYTLSQSIGEGHVYYPKETLILKARELLGVNPEPIWTQTMNLMMDKRLVIKEVSGETRVYSNVLYRTELSVARRLLDLSIKTEADEEYVRGIIRRLSDKLGMELDELQVDAVIKAVTNGVVILTGGPGTGKTTTINMMIKYFEANGLDFYLAAPTGRAAKRMTETTGYEASTIQRLLHLIPTTAGDITSFSYDKNEDNPLEVDVIIIDEMSMVDIQLFNALLKAVAVGTRLILVGDTNQLPSVGPGAVLKDIIASEQFPVVRLQKIFRQDEAGDIVINAHKINNGEKISLDNKSKDFFFLKRDNVDHILNNIIVLIKEKLPKYVEADSFDIQVLTPMRKGMLGVEKLNPILQQYLNPPSKDKDEKEYGNTLYRVGDKVMQVKNNYQLEWEITSKYGIPIDSGLGIFNGDMGIITAINEYNETVTVEFDDKRKVNYPYSGLDELELAYAVTIHKSQGSEYPAVIMPLLTGPQMLFNRNLLYTGVTRAKKCVTIIGSADTVSKMIENSNEQKRYTSLSEAIKEMCN
ncbi:MAG: ATP-dependent RecD-like DNA helicase [Lachnospiraceae bacterium]|nr:ATP-dependent RecD-like DNA helicase [Lachnospiraceae bacterium]